MHVLAQESCIGDSVMLILPYTGHALSLLDTTMQSTDAVQHMNWNRSTSPHITTSVPAAYSESLIS